MARWYFPTDPDCPEAKRFRADLFNDPMTKATDVGDEVWEDFENRHRRICTRCGDYGLANIEVR
jgi:hypothetical protein